MSNKVISVHELLEKITRHAYAEYDSHGEYTKQVVSLSKVKEVLEQSDE